jgi:antitoxin VapB
VAIFDRLIQVKKENGADLVEILRTYSEFMAPRFKPPYDTIDHGDLLYNELGLPK